MSRSPLNDQPARGFNPFLCRGEAARILSIIVAALAVIGWIGWVAMVSEGFATLHSLGWVMFLGLPVASYLASLVLLWLLRRAPPTVRLALAGTTMWAFAVGSWGYIWRWESTFTQERYAALFILPPLGVFFGLILWNWVKPSSGRARGRDEQ